MNALRPMTEAEYATWLEEAIPSYGQDKVASGQWTAAEALELSRQEHEHLLPQGLATPEHHFHTVVDAAGDAVGILWFAEKTKFGERIAYVFNIEIRPQRRRQGHALRAFQALEDEVRRLGLKGVALHVFGHNHAAQALYARLGYAPTNINLFKAVA